VAVKDILKDFAGETLEETQQRRKEEERVREEIENLLIRINRCFVDIVLPEVFAVENDLNTMGLWNQVNIGQSTSLSSGNPNIKEVTFSFYPEKTSTLPKARQAGAYQAVFRATGDLRKLSFSYRYPKRIPPETEIEERQIPVEAIDRETVESFLREFILGALDAFRSDTFFR